MANEEKKDFNAMLHRDSGMPKLQIVTDPGTIRKYGGERMYFAPPLAYDSIMKTVPPGKVITVGAIRAYLAEQNGADFIHRRLGQPSARRGPDPLLAHPESKRGTQRQISRRRGGAEGEAGGRRPYGARQGPEKHQILCEGL